MASTYEVVYKIAGQLSNQFKTSFKAASGAIKEAVATVGNLEKAAANSGSLLKLRNETVRLGQAYKAQKANLDLVETAMRAQKTPQAEIEASLKRERASLNATKEAWLRKMEALRKSGHAADAYGKAVAALTVREKKLEQAVRASARARELGDRASNVNSSAMVSASMVAMMGSRIKSFATAPVNQAMAIEDAMAEIRKVVDFDSPEAFEKMKVDLQAMSLRLPMATEGLMKITAAAGQAGIAREDLLKFTETAAKMGVAFDISAEEAGEMMAKWRSGMRLTQDEAEALADTVNALSNANAANGKQIGETLKRYGALGKVAGLSEKQTAALAATVIGAGAEAEVAATGINAFMRTMVKGAAMTDKQAKVFSALGFDPAVLQKAVQKDAPAAIMSVLERLKLKVPAEQQAAVMTTMFGEEGARALGPMLTNLEGLKKNFDLVASSVKTAGSMQAEFLSRSETTSNAFVLAGNAVDYFKTVLGDALLPSIKEYLREIVPVVSTIAEWCKQNKELVGLVVKITVGVLAGAVAFHTFRAAVLYSYGALLTLQKLFFVFKAGALGVASALPKVALTLKAVGVAMKGLMFNPLGLAVMGAMAAIAAGYLLWKNWDTVKEKATELWQAVVEKFPGISEAVDTASNLIKAQIGLVTTALKGVTQFVSSVFAGDWSAAWTAITDTFKGIFGGLAEIAKTPINAVIKLVNEAIDAINKVASFEVFGKKIGVEIPKVPELAKGGIATGSTLAKVGEGREPEAILPLSRLNSMLTAPASNAVTVNLTINAQGGAAGADIRTAAKQAATSLKDELQRLLANERRLAY